jgi:hypothetical protein
MTYSRYVQGSIQSVPKFWRQKVDHGENLVVSVYAFLNTANGSGHANIDGHIEQVPIQ